MLQQIPSALVSSLQTAPGFDAEAFIATHQSGEQVVSIRINPAKPTQLPIQPFAYAPTPVPWNADGYYLSERPSFTLDPAFHAGAYYVQEASSMFLAEALVQSCPLDKPLVVLDLCAAPGGKSTLLQSNISADSLLVSNEVIKARANILAENITKWGASNVVVANNDPKDFQRLPDFFDVIVVDAPCSGSGLFRKDPEAINEWSINNVELCSQRQQRILADILPALKPGGVLIYSTCSYSAAEDEEICDWLLAENETMHSLQLKINEEWGIVESISPNRGGHGYRFYPDKLKGEGFFIAVFKKHGEEIVDKKIKGRSKTVLANKDEENILNQYLLSPERFSFLKFKEEFIAFPKLQFDQLLQLQNTLYLKKAGVKIGAIIRGELIPDHELVVSTIFSKNIFTIPVNLQQALDYLRRKDIFIDTNFKGWAIIEYNGLPLGLAKILPNRINNYYPKEWRIINK